MKKMMKKVLCTALVILMCLTNAPLGGFVVLDFTAKAAEYQVGDIIEFGSYPQSEVKDETLIAELNALAPEWGDWTSYGYYSGAGMNTSEVKNYGTMVQGDWMRYTDVDFEGERYRGVKFTQYRPGGTFYTSSDTYGRYQDSNGYYVGTTYWFEFEPIKWKIINPDTGTVMSELLLDAQPYSNAIYFNPNVCEGEETDWQYDLYAYFNDFEYSNYASDYETSSIRQWLNNDFYGLAFTDTAKKEISVSEVKDAGYSNVVISNTTYDKIYLLSYGETGGLGTRLENEGGIGHGKTQPTDYAKCQGGGNSDTWNLRGSGFSSYQNWQWMGGCDNIFMNLVYHVTNIRPVFSFGDASKIHSHTYEITYSKHNTCQDGKVVYTCNCGATYRELLEEKHNCISEITDEATHLKEGKKTYTCLLCDYSYVETIPKTPEHFYEESTVTPPTCTSQGYTTYACKCGDTYTDNYVDTIDHTYTESIISQPTCNTVGQKQFYCTTCHTYKYETIPTNDEHIDNDNNGYCDRCKVLFAYTEGYYHYTVKDEKATIIDIDNSISGDIVIPSTLGGYPVTAIGDEAFAECIYITGATVPEGVINIGQLSFNCCIKLNSVVLPNSLESIDSGAFASCFSLKRITLPENVIEVTSGAFINCISLNEFVVCNSAASLGNYVGYTEAMPKNISIEQWLEKCIAYFEAEMNGDENASELEEDLMLYTEFDEEGFVVPSLVIYSHDPSTAKTYAEENGIPFKNISELEEPHTCSFGEWFTETEPTVFSEGVSKRVCECGEFETKPIAKLESASAKDETTKVEITYTEENFESEVEIVVSEEEINANIVFGDEFENYKAYDISLEADGEKIQPKGYVTVKLPIPEGFNADSTVVYYVDDSGNKTKLESTTENGYIVFETDHFSEYVLVDESSRIEPPHVHSYTASITKEATCTENGTTTYTCSCGDSYNETIEATGHDFDGSKCKNCDYDKADTCGCNCHKGGFMGFIWKIINFFNKLFKSKQYCACGAKHW